MASDRISYFQTDAVALAVRYGRPPFGPRLNADLLLEQVVVAVGSPLLIEKLGLREAGMNLTRYPLLHDAHNFWPQFLDRALPQGMSAPTRNIRIDETSLAIEAAVARQGLALMSPFFAADGLASGRLIRPFPTERQVGSDFCVFSPHKPRHPTPAAAVRTWLAAAAQRGSGTSLGIACSRPARSESPLKVRRHP